MNETRFACICMSPALDATVRLPRAPKGNGEIFKDVEEETNVGGKAVNVARWLALRGAKVACGGLLGEDNARPFETELAKYGIEDVFVRVPGETRRNEMLTWPGGSVKLNRAAFPELGKEGSWSWSWSSSWSWSWIRLRQGFCLRCGYGRQVGGRAGGGEVGGRGRFGGLYHAGGRAAGCRFG